MITVNKYVFEDLRGIIGDLLAFTWILFSRLDGTGFKYSCLNC